MRQNKNIQQVKRPFCGACSLLGSKTIHAAAALDLMGSKHTMKNMDKSSFTSHLYALLPSQWSPWLLQMISRPYEKKRKSKRSS